MDDSSKVFGERQDSGGDPHSHRFAQYLNAALLFCRVGRFVSFDGQHGSELKMACDHRRESL